MTIFEAREQEKLCRLLKALMMFRTLDPDIQCSMGATLLLVALNKDITRTEVMNRLDVAGSTATRNLVGLMEGARPGRPGHDLLEQRVNPDDGRWRHHRLNSDGEAFIRELLRVIDEDPSEGGSRPSSGV